MINIIDDRWTFDSLMTDEHYWWPTRFFWQILSKQPKAGLEEHRRGNRPRTFAESRWRIRQQSKSFVLKVSFLWIRQFKKPSSWFSEEMAVVLRSFSFYISYVYNDGHLKFVLIGNFQFCSNQQQRGQECSTAPGGLPWVRRHCKTNRTK